MIHEHITGIGNKIQGTDFTGYNGIQIEQINSIAGTVGGLTTNALEWLTFGETTFNLANLSMFGIEYGSMWGTTGSQILSGGLLSMTIGSSGPSFARKRNFIFFINFVMLFFGGFQKASCLHISLTTKNVQSSVPSWMHTTPVCTVLPAPSSSTS